MSADTDWMDYAREAIDEPSRVNLLGNSLVLIAPKDSSIDKVMIGQGFDLAKLAGNGKIATGDVKAVPVGKYARAALEKLGAWQAAEPKFAMAESVRAALTLVARGEAALGIVYATDARIEPGVKTVGTFPAIPIPRSSIRWRQRRPQNHKPCPTWGLLRSPALKSHLREIWILVLVQSYNLTRHPKSRV